MCLKVVAKGEFLEGVATGLTFGFPRWLSPSSVATRDSWSELRSPLAAPSVRASAIDASIIALGLASVLHHHRAHGPHHYGKGLLTEVGRALWCGVREEKIIVLDVTNLLFPYYKGREGQKNGNKFGWIEEN